MCHVHDCPRTLFHFVLDKEISDRDLAIIAQDHLTDWKALRPFLGLSHSQVTEILQSYPTDYQKQKHKCLIMWKETQGHEATYCALIRAAEDAQAQSLADGVRSVQPPTHSPHSQGSLWLTSVNAVV